MDVSKEKKNVDKEKKKKSRIERESRWMDGFKWERKMNEGSGRRDK